MNENEKDKEIKKTPEAYSYEDYEGGEMEDAQEGSRLEEVSESEDSLPVDICQTRRGVSDSESREFESGSLYSEEERKRLLMREKWLTITGKKPRNIPTLRKHHEEFDEKFIFFGDRKPREADMQITRQLLISSKRIEQEQHPKFAKVHRELKLPALFGGLMHLKFHPGGELLANCDRRGGLQVRRTDTGEVTCNLKVLESQEKLPVRTLKFLPNGNKLYAGGEYGVIQVFDPNDSELIASSESISVINCMDISPNGNFLATGGREGRVTIVDPHTLQVTSVRARPANEGLQPNVNEYHRLRVYAIRCHPTEANVFLTGGWDGIIKIWDVRTPAAMRSIKCPVICGDGLDVANNNILTTSWQAENGLGLWDFQSGKLIKNIPVKGRYTKFEGEFLYTGRFFHDDPAYNFPNSNMIAIGGAGFTEVLLVNIETNKVLQCFPSLKTVLCIDVYRNLIVYGGKESVFRIAEVHLKQPSRR